MITAHSVQPALHRVLLDEVPSNAGARSAHRAFESEYLERYRSIVVAARGDEDPTTDTVVQVLSAAVEGVIHGAARRGTLKSPDLKRELLALIHAYLMRERRQSVERSEAPAARSH